MYFRTKVPLQVVLAVQLNIGEYLIPLIWRYFNCKEYPEIIKRLYRRQIEPNCPSETLRDQGPANNHRAVFVWNVLPTKFYKIKTQMSNQQFIHLKL